MKSTQERDLLIAQTMAFAQSVIGEPSDSGGRLEPLPMRTLAMQSPVELTLAPLETRLKETCLEETYPEAFPVAASLALYDDLREEIRRRVAAFRAHQELLRRDRDEYYNSVLAKVRNSNGLGRMAPDNRPVKR
jgi:hypothetical protein